MFSRRLQLSFFIAALHHQYRARLEDMVFPFVTSQILDFLACLKNDKLISAFTVYPQSHKSAFKCVRVVFYYVNNNGLLFQHIRGIRPRLYFSTRQICLFLQKKASLAFPVLIFETPTHGIITDRQLVYLQLHLSIPNYLGGRLVARIDNY